MALSQTTQRSPVWLTQGLLRRIRHGQRLDAADRKWHASTATPYDPPLTYGGWLQAKALGAKIASILRIKEEEVEAEAKEQASGDDGRQSSSPKHKRKRKRFDIVIHSSPFLRCVQTAVGVSAGLAENPPLLREAGLSARRLSRSDTSPLARPKLSVTAESPIPGAIPIGSSVPRASTAPRTGMIDASVKVHVRKSVLRLDAFLGEWLSTEYYDLVVPPPSSKMVDNAKLELLRREYYDSYPHLRAHANSMGAVPGSGHLWGARQNKDLEPGSLENLPVLPPALLERASPATSSLSQRRVSFSVREPRPHPLGYVAPVPAFAMSPNSQIPPGYVSHAKDACVLFDYQWDSAVKPLSWGDGGQFPEEWNAMHLRFRGGLQSMVDWYMNTDEPTKMVTKLPSPPQKGDATPKPRRGSMSSENAIDETDESESGEAAHEESDEEDVEFDVEPVVIIISHGAGCNALIGAITHQPALMDVGLASLTMAVRRPDWQLKVPTTVGSAPSLPIHRCYDLVLTANTEHLRASSLLSPHQSRSPSIAYAAGGASPSLSRGRLAASSLGSGTGANNSSSLDPYQGGLPGGSRASSANAALGSIRRPSHVSTSVPRTTAGATMAGAGGPSVSNTATASPIRQPSDTPVSPGPVSVGLWSPRRQSSARTSSVSSSDDKKTHPAISETVPSGSASPGMPKVGVVSTASPTSTTVTLPIRSHAATDGASSPRDAGSPSTGAATRPSPVVGISPDLDLDLPVFSLLGGQGLGTGVGGLWGPPPSAAIALGPSSSPATSSGRRTAPSSRKSTLEVVASNAAGSSGSGSPRGVA